MILSQTKTQLLRNFISFCSTFLLLISPFEAKTQVATTLNNPSACGLNIALSDFSCPENSSFYNPDRFEINVTNAPGLTLGQDVFLSEVRILLEHEWLSDVQMVLVSPGGQSVMLLGNIGGNENNLGDTSLMNCTGAMRLEYASCIPLKDGVAPFVNGPYRAQEDFYVFNDGMTDPNQSWELQICDDLEDDAGVLQYVELVFLPMECLPVQELTIESQDTTAVTFSYYPNDGYSNAIVEIGPPGFTPGVDENPGQGTVFNVSTNPFTLSSLAEDRVFDIYIRKACGGSFAYSINSCGDQFKTSCNPQPMTSLSTFDDEAICTPDCTQKCDLSGDWRNVNGDDFDWIVFSGSSPTANTGPDDDITMAGQYLYIESNGSDCEQGAKAFLQSACFILDKQGSDTCNLSFNYHMKGLHIGDLSVEASQDGGLSWSELWTISGHQGNDWNTAYIGLGQYADGTELSLRIIASKGNGVFGDIAIDHIALRGSVFSFFPSNILYVDGDTDGYGSSVEVAYSCLEEAPLGYSFNHLDCDDTDADINPDAEEIPCNEIDDNCNNETINDDIILPTPITQNDTICSGEIATITAEADPNFFVLWYDNPDGLGDFLGFNASFSPDLPENNTAFPVVHTFYARVTDFFCESPELGVAHVLVLPNPLGFIVGQEPEICPGESVDLASVDIQDSHFTGASISFHQDWPTDTMNVLESSIVEPVVTTDYFYRLSSSDRCFYQDTVSVFRKNGPQLSFLPADSFSLCKEFLDTIEVVATGGLPPYEYFWSTGHFTTEIAVQGSVTAGVQAVYAITVTDDEACFSIDSVLVNTTNSIDSLRVFTEDVSTCEGSDGSITIVPLNGQAPFAYVWADEAGNTGSNNSFQDTIRILNLPQNAYRLTITDSSPEGCEVSLRNIRVQGPGFQISGSNIDNPSCAGFSDGEICLDVSGSGNITYQWSDGQVSSCAEGLAAGQYSVTISNGECTAIEAFTIKEPEQLRLVTNFDMPSCAATTDGSLSVTAYGGVPFYTYEWSTGQSIATLSSIGAGTYTLSLTDFNDCLLDTQIVLTAPEPLSAQIDSLANASCFGFEDGLLRVEGLGGTAPYQYLWDNESTAPQRIGLGADTYALTITDFNQCSHQQTFIIDEPDSLRLNLFSITQPICKGDATGRIIVTPQGGTPNYEYMWNDGFVTANTARTGLEVGAYWVVLRDAGQCVSDTLFIDLQPASSLDINLVLTEPLCVGQENGNIALNVGGIEPLSFNWSNGATTQNLMDIGVGEYCVTATDARGCIQDSCFYLDGLQLFTINSTIVQPSCFGDNDGIIDQTLIEQGQPPFQFFWDDGSQHVDRLFLEPGDYNFTVTDANDCAFYSDTFSIVYPAPLSLEVTDVGNINCFGDASGYFETSGAGGTPPYSYNWAGTAEENSNIYNLEAGLHQLILNDARNCEIDTLLSLSDPLPMHVDVDYLLGNVCEPDNFDELISTVTGGTMPYHYEWTTGETSQSLINPIPGDYFLTVSDANDCQFVFGTIKVKDRIPALVLDSFIVEQVRCFEGDDASMTAYISGGSGEFNYHFSPTYIETTMLDSVRVNGLTFDQNYSVTVTDEKSSCVVESEIITGVQPDQLSIQRDSFSLVNCFGGADGAVFVTVEGGTMPYFYNWTNDEGQQVSQEEDLQFASPGIYHLLVTDSQNCMVMYSDSNVVTHNESLELIATEVEAVSCKDGNDGAIDMELEGGRPPYFYAWSNDATTEDIDNLSAGFYTLTITDSDTCRTIFPSVFVPQPLSSINISAVVDSIDCFGEASGQIDATISGGGGPPYVYRWRRNNILLPAINDNIADHLQAGVYQLAVLDTNNCEEIVEFQLDDPSEMLANIINLPLGSDSLLVEVTGGMPPYTILWSTGANSFVIKMLSSGDYAVLVTDENGCETMADFILTATDKLNPFAFQLLIYPNPSTGAFYMRPIEKPLRQGTELHLFSALGKKVWSKTLLHPTEELLVDLNLSAGVYQLVLKTKSGENWSAKIVIVD